MTDTPCICIKMRRASQAITKLYDDALAPAGVNITQFSQLHAIARLKTPSIGALATETHLDRSTLGRNIKVLIRLGLAQYQPGADERSRIVTITEKGRRTLMKATPIWESVQGTLSEKLGEDDGGFFATLRELEALAP